MSDSEIMTILVLFHKAFPHQMSSKGRFFWGHFDFKINQFLRTKILIILQHPTSFSTYQLILQQIFMQKLPKFYNQLFLRYQPSNLSSKEPSLWGQAEKTLSSKEPSLWGQSFEL
jgi:hypothetical protein